MVNWFKTWGVALVILLAALGAQGVWVLRASMLAAIRERSGVSQNLWLVDLSLPDESFPYGRLARLARTHAIAVGFPPYQKTELGGKPQPTLQPLNAEWIRQVSPLRAGRLPRTRTEMLAVQDGAYRLGEQVAAYRVVGLISPAPWRPVSDATLFQLVTLGQDRPPVSPTMLVIRAASREAAEDIARQVVGSDAGYAVSPALNAVLAEGFLDVELQSLSTVSRLSAFLLALALLGLCDALAARWAQRREEWRTERALGRPARTLALRCLGESSVYWLPGVVVAGVGAGALAQVLHVPQVTGQLAALTLVFVLVASAVMALFAWRIASFPLARASLEGRRGSQAALLPLVCAALMVFAGATLLSDALARRAFAASRIAALGADRIDIGPDYSAAFPLGEAHCRKIAALVDDCLAYGVVNAPPQVRGASLPGWNRVTLMDAGAARGAGIELLSGRWPRPGRHELALSQTAFRQLEVLGLGLNARLDKNAPFVAVGVVKNYAGQDMPDFANPVFASPGDPLFTRFPRVMPLGTSGLIVHTRRAHAPTLRAIRRQIGSRVTALRPASLMLSYRDSARRDLLRTGLLLGASGLICLQVFASFVGNVVARLSMEIALWRTLGMTRARVARRLLGRTLGPLGAGVLLGLVALLAAHASGAGPSDLGLAVGVGLTLGLLLLGVSGGVALGVVRGWTRLPPRALLLRLESA